MCCGGSIGGRADRGAKKNAPACRAKVRAVNELRIARRRNPRHASAPCQRRSGRPPRASPRDRRARSARRRSALARRRGGGMPLEHEAPAPARGEADADARQRQHAATARASAGRRETHRSPRDEVAPAVAHRQPECPRQIPGPARQRHVGRRPSPPGAAAAHTPPGPRAARARATARRRPPLRLGHQVQAVVHAVGEVDVRVPGRPEHHGVARRAATMGVTGGISGAAIRLDLDDAAGDARSATTAHQHAADQRARDHGRSGRA